MVTGFIILFGLTMLYLAATSRIVAHIRILIVQGLLLFLICCFGMEHHNWLNFVFLTIETLIVKSIVIPARSLMEVSKMLEDSEEIINIYIDSNAIMIDKGDTKIISRLLEGDFINYKQIIPANYETFVNVNKIQLEDALERVSLLTKVGQNNYVKFEIRESVMNLSSTSEIGNINEKISCVTNGKDLDIAFNPRFILESLKAVSNEFVKICFNKSANPCVIVPTEQDEFLYLILPVRMF